MGWVRDRLCYSGFGGILMDTIDESRMDHKPLVSLAEMVGLKEVDMANWLQAALLLAPPEVQKAVEDGFVKVDGNTISITIQTDPIGRVGVNGAKFTTLIGIALGQLKFFDRAHSCRENSLTKTKLEEALHWQLARTQDRENRGVEGKMET